MATTSARLPAAAAGAFVVAAGFVAALRPAIDPDLAWHLRTGRLILATGTIPRTDPYSYTMRGAPWVEHEWLWQVGMAAIDRAGGRLGLVVANALLVAVTLALVYLGLRQRRASPVFAAVGAAAALAIWMAVAQVRPAMVSGLFAAAFVLLLERYAATGNWRWLAGLLPCQLLWANCHGSFVEGFGLVTLYAAGALWRRPGWKAPAVWASLLTSLMLVSAINPRGPGLLLFAAHASGLPFNRQHINEWMSPNLQLWLWGPLVGSILLAVGLGLRGGGRRLGWPGPALLTGSMALALLSQQFIDLYAVAGAPLLALMLQQMLDRPGPARLSLPSGAALAAALLMLTLTGPVQSLRPVAYRAEMERYFPVGAVNFVKRHHLSGPLWNDFDWGGYLIGALPRIPVFVDGRTEVYGETFLNRYLRVASAEVPAGPVLDRYGVNLVLVRRHSPIAMELRGSGGWRQVYGDATAALFVRRGAAA
ncbi:MAG: hypothetical protein ACYDAG_15730 [Chloroflexota bacterium]